MDGFNNSEQYADPRSQPPRPPIHRKPPPSSFSYEAHNSRSQGTPDIATHRGTYPTAAGTNGTYNTPPVPTVSASHTAAANPPLIRKNSFEEGDDAYMRKAVQGTEGSRRQQRHGSEGGQMMDRPQNITQNLPLRQRQMVEATPLPVQPQSGLISSANGSLPNSRQTSGSSWAPSSPPHEESAPQPLQYHHQIFDAENKRNSVGSDLSKGKTRQNSADFRAIPSPQGRLTPSNASLLGATLPRPLSGYSSSSEAPRRTFSPSRLSDGRTPSPSRTSVDNRPMSYIDLLNVPYPQPPPAPVSLDNSRLRSSVGQNASLLSTKKTLEMYRDNVKKSNDTTLQYEFAVFLINTSQEMAANNGSQLMTSKESKQAKIDPDDPNMSQVELLREARHILQRLSDRSYPFAQYYLADGYASGLLAKGTPDNDRAFPLFIAASKHGHAEAGYRAALCYEFGWGCRRDLQKAVQYYRQSASKNHPGAMSRLGMACLQGDMGLGNRYKEGLKWLKRAAESADFQYNAAPYELGLLHSTGFGDDIFKDESYTAQLFTQSADLGHAEANFRLGEAYEHGKLTCPRDPALSVHFYTGAAQRGHPQAMMALCAWYMIGAEPVLEKDEAEAYEWARKAAETSADDDPYPKAEFAVGYFTETGIGCRRDPLEANVWYVRAADHGEERAKHRLASIRAAASGQSMPDMVRGGGAAAAGGAGKEKEKKKWGLF